MNTQNIKDRRDRKIGGVSTIKDDIELIMTDIPDLLDENEGLRKGLDFLVKAHCIACEECEECEEPCKVIMLATESIDGLPKMGDWEHWRGGE